MESRPFMRRLEQDTPQAGEDDPLSRKRARTGLAIAMQTPSAMRAADHAQPMDTPMLLSTATKDRPLGYSSELLEYLRGRGSKIKELEEELGHARQRSDALQAEVHARQDQVLQLQQQLSAARAAAAQKVQVSGQLQLVELERLLDEELRKGVELEGRLEEAQDARRAAERAAAEASATAAAAKAQHVKQLSELQLQAAEAKRALKVLQVESEERARRMQLELTLERTKRDADQEMHRTMLQQLEERQAAAAARAAALGGGAAGALGLRVQQLEEQLRLKDSELKRVMAQAQQAAAAAATSAVNAAQTLANSGGSDGAGIAPSAQTAATVSAALAAELGAVQARLRAWEQGLLQQVLAASCDSCGSTPEEAAAAIKHFAQQVTELRSCMAAKDAELLEVAARATGAEQRCKVLETAAAAHRAELQAAVTAEKAGARQLAVVTQERDALRRALAVPPSISNPKTVSHQLQVEQQGARCEQLQALVTDLQAQLAAAQNEAAAATGAEATRRVEVQEAKQRAEAAEARCAQLEKEADSLALDVATLQTKLGQGEVNRSSVRVLHFKLNPETQYHREKADSTAAELRAENDALKRRLEELAEDLDESRRKLSAAGGGNSSSKGPAAANAAAAHSVVRELAAKEAEVAVLRHRLSELEKTMVRLKEVTKERIVAFREACYALFGYRVDMTAEATAAKDAASAPTTFSLKPQHADDPNLMLVFRYTRARGMELVPNAFSAKMAREVDTFIHKFKCIPAFTANLTIENFQKQTQC